MNGLQAVDLPYIVEDVESGGSNLPLTIAIMSWHAHNKRDVRCEQFETAIMILLLKRVVNNNS